jgi:NADP-reducing hydrogenase subunit HndC
MLEILNRICDGEGKEGDIKLLLELGEHIKETSLCGLGQTAPNPVLSTVKYFRNEYEAHIYDNKCPAGVCQELASAYIIHETTCVGCGQCVKVCPVDAITKGDGNYYVIDENICISCGACEKKCPVDAISQG